MTNSSLRESAFDFSQQHYIESPATPEQQAVRDTEYLIRLIQAVATSYKTVALSKLVLDSLQRSEAESVEPSTPSRPLSLEETESILEAWGRIKKEGFSLDEYTQE